MKKLLALTALALLVLGSGAAEAGSGKTVGIRDFAFHPGTLTVKKGTVVTFSNKDGVSHTATSGSFDTGKIKPGKSVSIRFKRKGTFAFHCKIHPDMHGKVVVD